MRLSHNFTKTTKDIPSDETSKNAQLLIRAGFVHKAMAGVYAYLPLGLRVLNKIENIVRKHLNEIGGQEILMNSLHPKSWWETTDRWDAEKVDVLFRLESQTKSQYALACSHEEQVVPIAKSFLGSYKDLPIFRLGSDQYYKSYLMGVEVLTVEQLASFGGIIHEETEKGSYKLFIPKDKLTEYIQYLEQNLKVGFWNEVVAGSDIQFLFKISETKIKQFKLNLESSVEIYKLWQEFLKEEIKPLNSQEALDFILKDFQGSGAGGFYQDFVEGSTDKPNFTNPKEEYLFEFEEEITQSFDRTQERYATHCFIFNPKLGKYLVTDDPLKVCSLYENYLVGGKIETGENPQEALVREIKEETGIGKENLTKIKPLGKIKQTFLAPAFKDLTALKRTLISEMFYVETDFELDGFADPHKKESQEYSIWRTKEEIYSSILHGFAWILDNLDNLRKQQNLLPREKSTQTQFPVAIYQVQTKFRDELRSKSGIMRGREFRMKDMYDFHITQESADNYYELVKKTYFKIYAEMGLEAFAVHASGGMFTGNDSHEFQVICEAGEDEIFYNKEGFAVNSEILEELKAKNQQIPENLQKAKSAEVGNIFKLGDKYSKAFDLKIVDKNNKQIIPIMNCHGIGTSRCMGVIAEIYSDEKGLKWPESVAPFKFHLITHLDKDETVNQKILTLANKIYKNQIKIVGKNEDFKLVDPENLDDITNFTLSDLESGAGELLWDDRSGVSLGEKFKDADLIGCPFQIIISKKSLENGGFEIKRREDGQSWLIKF